LRGKYHIEVIAVRDVLKDQIQMLPRADFVIKGSEVLVVIGKEEDIDKIK
jgi:trk system potassium uptake protein TrkA